MLGKICEIGRFKLGVTQSKGIMDGESDESTGGDHEVGARRERAIGQTGVRLVERSRKFIPETG